MIAGYSENAEPSLSNWGPSTRYQAFISDRTVDGASKHCTPCWT